MNRKLTFIFLLSWLVSGCDTSLPSEEANNDAVITSGEAATLTSSEYASLDSEAKYQVANKLAGALYKGVPVDEFFNVSAGMRSLQTTSTGDNYIDDFRRAINTDLDADTLNQIKAEIYGLDVNGNIQEDAAKYRFSSSDQPKEEPYALIYDYPLSRNSFIASIALFLSNTIMFTCAEEMESTNVNDCQKTYTYLVTQLNKKATIRETIRGYMPSIMNWRIGRSGQNVGVEGMEEFLGLFDRAADADKVGIACQDIILLPEDQDYELSQTNFPNTQPQIILQEDTNGDGIVDSGGSFITTCEDFYNVVAGHALTLPRVCEVVTNYFLAGQESDDRLAFCNSLLASGVDDFESLFKGVIFSREYLLEAEHVVGYDRFVLPMLSTLHWDVRIGSGDLNPNVWRNMASNTFNSMYMGRMSWDTMTMKIGRLGAVPMDALSFINYHNSIRSDIFFNSNAWVGRRVNIDGTDVYIPGLLFMSDEVLDPSLDQDTTEDSVLRPEIEALSPEDYLKFLFLTALKRSPTSEESTALLQEFESRGHWFLDSDNIPDMRDSRFDDMARDTFDYISRLSETYYYRRVNS